MLFYTVQSIFMFIMQIKFSFKSNYFCLHCHADLKKIVPQKHTKNALLLQQYI